MPHFGQTIRSLRLARGFRSQEAFADSAGIHRNTMSRIEKLPSASIQGSTYRLLAQALGLTTAQLDQQWRQQTAPQRRTQDQVAQGIPVFEQIPAGVGDYDPTALGLDEGLADWYIPRQLVGVDDPGAFAVPVVGDSMQPVYQPGDVVICAPAEPQFDGMEAAVRLETGECTLKRVYDLGDGRLELRPYNDAHPVRIVHREAVVRLAVVVGVFKRRPRASSIS